MRQGRNASVSDGFPRNGFGGEEKREQVGGKEGLKEKEREIKERLDYVDREIEVEKVMEVERALRALA